MVDDARLQQQIGEAMVAGKIAGLGIAVVDGDKITYSEVFGTLNSPSRKPLTPATQLQGASLSKPVFAYAVLKLCEQGLLDLDTPLVHYWPEPPCADPRTARITARHVLSHTTGFPSWRDEDEAGSGQLRLLANPGITFCYSGEGFQYLQQVIEHLTQQPLHTLIKTHLFTPVGMNDSTFAWAIPGPTITLDENNNPVPVIDEEGNIVGEGPYLMANAAYSLLTTAYDYGKFLLTMLNPVPNDPVRLNITSVAAMLTPQVQVGTHANLQWGLGWGIQQTAAGAISWHWGGQNDYFNYVAFLPHQRKGVAVFTNTDGGLTICEAIARMALGIDVHHPAFDWLLPVEQWQPQG